MEGLDWKQEYSVGVEILDRQHQYLLGILNDLIEHSQEPKAPGAVSEALYKMNRYAHIHFLTEERFLTEQGYSDMERHQRQHREFEAQAERFAADAEGIEFELTDALLNFLKQWWIHHILEEDMKYKPLLENATLG